MIFFNIPLSSIFYQVFFWELPFFPLEIESAISFAISPSMFLRYFFLKIFCIFFLRISLTLYFNLFRNSFENLQGLFLFPSEIPSTYSLRIPSEMPF